MDMGKGKETKKARLEPERERDTDRGRDVYFTPRKRQNEKKRYI